MLRSMFITVIAVTVSGGIVLQADDVKKTKSPDKPAVKQVQKKQPVLLQKADKTKQPQKQRPVAGTIGSDTDYYTTSPAQGRPADGRLPAGTKVKVIEKAGSYVRVMAVIEAYVPADSVKELEQPPAVKKQPPGDKAAASKDKAAAEKKAAIEKQKAPGGKPIFEKKQPVKDGAALKQKAAAEKDATAQKKAVVDKAALKKKAIAEKKAAAEKQETPIDKAALKKKAIAEKKAAAGKETEKKVEKK